MVKTKSLMSALTLGALGVVFGDIGTSPLYAFQTLFGHEGSRLSINQENIYGLISLIIWSITLVVTIKFIIFIMRADNHGEGGILALVSLIKSSTLLKKYKSIFIFIGLIGVCLFYGDSVITPAISLLSAVQGLNVALPALSSLIIPITLAIVIALFWLQKYGTGTIGKLFGPVMLLWFLVIGLGGLRLIVEHPGILNSLSPFVALSYAFSHPVFTFIAMSAVVLAITGAEALYADMGHFGKAPITRAWLFVVFPALALNYMGQGALILSNSKINTNILVQMYPSFLQFFIVLLATFATLIASQSVISGAFSLTKQAVQLQLLPKLLIKHTSKVEAGRVYIPFVNFLMFVIVCLLIVGFGSSNRLANAYGMAVSGTLAADSILFLVVLKSVWRKTLSTLLLVGILFVPLDILFVSSNAYKLFHGGLFPIIIAIVILIIINIWTKGNKIVDRERLNLEGTLTNFISDIHTGKIHVSRIPGVAVYVGHHSDYVPMALKATAEEQHELPATVIIVTIEYSTAAHVALEDRVVFNKLDYVDGLIHLTLIYGYHDTINIPSALDEACKINPELVIDTATVPYYISLNKVVPSRRHNLMNWQKYIYSLMYRNALSNTDYYKLPINQTEEISTLIRL